MTKGTSKEHKCSCGFTGQGRQFNAHLMGRKQHHPNEEHHEVFDGVVQSIVVTMQADETNPALMAAQAAQEDADRLKAVEALKQAAFAAREQALLDQIKQRLAIEQASIAATPPPPAPVVVTAAAPPPPPAATIKAAKNTGKWAKVLLGLLVLGAGVGIVGYMYAANPKSPVFIVGLPVAIGGAYLLYRAFTSDSTAPLLNSDKKALVPPDSRVPKSTGTENCLNIYPREKGGIRFEHIDNPEGTPQKCENDNHWYYVNIWDRKQIRLVPLSVPDMKYFDPKEFANIFDAEPIRRFFEIRFGNLERMAPFVFLGMIAIFLLALIILPGALKGNPTEEPATEIHAVPAVYQEK